MWKRLFLVKIVKVYIFLHDFGLFVINAILEFVRLVYLNILVNILKMEGINVVNVRLGK